MARIPKSAVPSSWIDGAKSSRNTQRKYVELKAANLGDGRYRVTLPVYLPSVANLREHWAAKAKRTKNQRLDGNYVVWVSIPSKSERMGNSWKITLTRIGPKPLDTHENLPISFKAMVDGIAETLGCDDDSDSRLEWVYRQERRGNLYGVEILLEPRA